MDAIKLKINLQFLFGLIALFALAIYYAQSVGDANRNAQFSLVIGKIKNIGGNVKKSQNDKWVIAEIDFPNGIVDVPSLSQILSQCQWKIETIVLPPSVSDQEIKQLSEGFLDIHFRRE